MPKEVPCPQCGSTKLYKDGLRYLADGSIIQRWLCRNCAYRFSENSNTAEKSQRVDIIDRQPLNRYSERYGTCQVCDLLTEESKNLATTTETKTVSGDREIDKKTAKGLLLQYALHLQKEGYGQNSRYVTFIRMLLNSGCNVNDPENVKEAIGQKKWKNGTKMLCCYAYDALTKMLGINWVMPKKYKQEEHLFFLPEEKELDALIHATKSRRMSTYLQTLKETWTDPSEALGLRWIDVDSNRNIIAVNRPVKDHSPRELEVTPQLIAMINALPKTSQLIFPVKYATLYNSYKKLRQRVAQTAQNPRILSIKLTSFRHWGGTMLAWLSNGNVLIVKQKLGHKRVENTMKYIARLDYKINQDFEVVTATTDEEIKKYGEAGYQKYDERTIGAVQISYYRRPKKFQGLKI